MEKIRVERIASKGITAGKIRPVVKQVLEADLYIPEAPEKEIAIYDAAVKKVAGKLEKQAQDNAIFGGHLELVKDIALQQGVMDKIQNGQNVQQALVQTVDEYRVIFEMMDDEYMRERAADIVDVRDQLLRAIKGIEELSFTDLEKQTILVAKDLTPSDTATINFERVCGFITEEGGVTSHVSIIARNHAVPAFVGVSGIMDKVRDQEEVILDAVDGYIILEPDEQTKAVYLQKIKDYDALQTAMEQEAGQAAVTTDGHSVQVCANVGNLQDVEQAVTKGIDGIGLFRSEFLYMENTHFPTEEEQFEAYKKAAEQVGKDIIIRTLDIGGDKELSYYAWDPEENPFLGWRAIRICLTKKDIFKTQLRALLRASAYGTIRIMYPMIISLEELREANALLKECKEELRQEKISFDENIQTGIMMETPASVFLAQDFAKEVEFFSIGTNDLTQYVLAVDRGNTKIAALYDSFHPAVIRAIAAIITAGHQAGISVGMCGEFASDENAIRLLLGLGLDEFSVNAGSVALVKHKIRNSSLSECQKLAKTVLEKTTTKEVYDCVRIKK
ncbi:MAG: phosphoenolpyruvate--protein phosphotransferase [Lachnospiraceae bacterium]